MRTLGLKRAILLSLSLSLGSNFSLAGSLNTVSVPRFACLSIDGIPIAIGTPLAEKCCFGEGLRVSAGEECRIGFFGGALGAARNGLSRIEEVSGVKSKEENGEASMDENASSDSEAESFFETPAGYSSAAPVMMPRSVTGSVPGSAADSREYFLRIDKKTSLFDVVSKRYQKEIEIPTP